MSLSTATVTMNLSDMLGTDFDTRRTKVWISTNVPGNTVIDTVGNAIRLGTGTVTLNTDGTASVAVWKPGTGSNPASWQTTIHVSYPALDETGAGRRTVRDFGPFTITADADLADLVAEQEVPPEYASALVAELQGYVDQAQAIIDSGGGGGGGTVTPDATTTVKGKVELATNTETVTGTDTVRATTPAGVAAALAASVPTVADASTTVKGIVELATNAEATTGTDTARAVTPAGVKAVLDAVDFTLELAAAQGIYNLGAASYSTWDAAVAGVIAGTASTVLACVGDSTTLGQGAASAEQSYPALLVSRLQAAEIPAARTWQLAYNGTEVADRVTRGGAWSYTGSGYWQLSSGASGDLTFVPSSASGPPRVDRIEIYTASASGGTLDVRVGGASVGSVVPGSGTPLKKTTVSFTATDNPTIVLRGTAVAGDTYLVGFNAYLSTSKVVQVANVGVGGTQSTSWSATDNAWTPPMYGAVLTPSLHIYDIGINDANPAGANRSAAAYKTEVQTYITRAKLTGDVLLKSMIPTSDRQPRELEYIAKLKELAVTNNLALIDVFDRWGGFAASDALGRYQDQTHATGIGYSDVAAAVMLGLRYV